MYLCIREASDIYSIKLEEQGCFGWFWWLDTVIWKIFDDKFIYTCSYKAFTVVQASAVNWGASFLERIFSAKQNLRVSIERTKVISGDVFLYNVHEG